MLWIDLVDSAVAVVIKFGAQTLQDIRRLEQRLSLTVIYNYEFACTHSGVASSLGRRLEATRR